MTSAVQHGPVFHEGTIVRMKFIPPGCPNELISKFGVVVIPNKYGFMAVGVEFMEWEGGHTLGNRTAKNGDGVHKKSGWFVMASKLEATSYQRSGNGGNIVLMEAA